MTGCFFIPVTEVIQLRNLATGRWFIKKFSVQSPKLAKRRPGMAIR
jgi:hypothetical protein